MATADAALKNPKNGGIAFLVTEGRFLKIGAISALLIVNGALALSELGLTRAVDVFDLYHSFMETHLFESLWIPLTALAVGKPLFISLCMWIGMQFGLKLPNDMSFKEVIVMGQYAGIGFTVAIFIAMQTLSGPLLSAATLAALASWPVCNALAALQCQIFNIGKQQKSILPRVA